MKKLLLSLVLFSAGSVQSGFQTKLPYPCGWKCNTDADCQKSPSHGGGYCKRCHPAAHVCVQNFKT